MVSAGPNSDRGPVDDDGSCRARQPHKFPTTAARPGAPLRGAPTRATRTGFLC